MAERTWLLRTIAAVLFMAALLSACSGDDELAQAGSEVIDLREDGTVDAGGDTEPTTTIAVEDIEIVDEPAVRAEPNESFDASNWVARTYNDSVQVDIVWSPVDGADEYKLYRLLTSEADYDAITAGNLDGAEEIFSTDEDLGFIDRDVPEGEFLSYVLVAEVDGEFTEPRWTEALTVDDTTPPAPITGLTAIETPDGILLEWQPSPDNVEFASYSVSILEENDQLRYIGGGADVGQVSFLDDEPFTGERTYVVVAVDFHNNVSDPGQIQVTVE